MNIKQYKFVTEYLRFSDKIVAYHNAYPHPTRNDRATESAANRLMQHPEVSKAISDAQETCMSQAMEDLKDQMKEELLTVYQKRLLCKHVVLGEVREEVVFKGKGCTHCSYFREIPYSVKLRYSKEDSLLAGHYPTKRASKHNPPIETCNISQQIPPLKEVPDNRRAEDVHSQETNETQETRNISQQPNEVSSTSQPDNTSPLGRGVGVGSRDEPTHTTNETPEKEPQRLSVSAVKQPRTISHAGLRKLLNKQRIKKQQPLIFTPCV